MTPTSWKSKFILCNTNDPLVSDFTLPPSFLVKYIFGSSISNSYSYPIIISVFTEDPSLREVFQLPGRVTVSLGAVPVILAAGIS